MTPAMTYGAVTAVPPNVTSRPEVDEVSGGQVDYCDAGMHTRGTEHLIEGLPAGIVGTVAPASERRKSESDCH